jgi:hypothetical protein
MRHRTIAVAALLLASPLVACSAKSRPSTSRAPSASADMVRALRYRTFVGDPMFGIMRGGGHQVTELWFPEQGVLARMGESVRIEPPGWVGDAACGGPSKADQDGPPARWEPTAMAAYGPIGNDQRYVMGGSDRVEPVEEVRVPRALAERLFALAQARRANQLREREAGAALEASGLLSPPAGE